MVCVTEAEQFSVNSGVLVSVSCTVCAPGVLKAYVGELTVENPKAPSKKSQ